MLSPYTKNLFEKRIPTEKLIPNLRYKVKYVLHYENLKLYVRFGMKITCVHRILKFDQSQWIKPYIDLNTEKRNLAKTAFEKDFYKLLNNALFG